MLIDPDTEAGRQWIADNAADMDGDVERLLHDHTQVCEVCGNRFTDDDMDDGICWECHGAERYCAIKRHWL